MQTNCALVMIRARNFDALEIDDFRVGPHKSTSAQRTTFRQTRFSNKGLQSRLKWVALFQGALLADFELLAA